MKNIFYLLLALKVLGIEMSWYVVMLPVVMIGLYYNIALVLAYMCSREQNINFLDALDMFTKK